MSTKKKARQTAPIQKNESYTVTITGMTAEGSGVAKIQDFAVFIPDTAIGDTVLTKIVKVLKSYAFGIPEEIVSPSPDRIENDCQTYQQCGGCCYRHLSYEAELRLKQQLVEDCFHRLGGIELGSQPIVGSERIDGYRNKAQYPVGVDVDGKAVAGFYAKRSHRIVSCSNCKLQPFLFGEIVSAVLDYINEKQIPVYDEKSCKGAIRHIYLRQAEATDELMLCVVSAHKKLPFATEFCERLIAQFPQIKSIILNYNPKKGNVILGSKCWTLFGKDTISDILSDVKVEISPLSFYQVNKAQAQRLYEQGLAFAELTPDTILLDLYCGIGTIGLSAAERIKTLIGVEIIPQAIENAKHNAEINHFTNTSFLCADCKTAVQELEESKLSPDIILVDPPRKGCDTEVLDTIVRLSPSRVVMISCNPATAARDCKLLEEKGYQVMQYRPFDLFPRTGHVECCILLSHKSVKQKSTQEMKGYDATHV